MKSRLVPRRLRSLLSKVQVLHYKVVWSATLGYMEGLVELTLCEIAARALAAHTGKSKLLAGVVGHDPHLFGSLEALRDFGFAIGGHYGSREDDPFHPSRPLAELDAGRYDVLIVGAGSAGAEEAVVADLRKAAERNYPDGLPCPVLRIQKMRSSLYTALSKLKAGHFISCLNPRKMALVALCLSWTRDGCVVECGTYLGGTSMLMGTLLREWGDPRRIHTIDTFEGMPQPTGPDGETVYQAGMFSNTSYETVKRHFAAQGLSQTVKAHKGLAQETLSEVWRDEGAVSFALVDTDQYAGTAGSLKEILPRLAKNGIILVDDYSVDGVRRAVEEAAAEWPSLKGALITYNLYMLWNQTDQGFLSNLV